MSGLHSNETFLSSYTILYLIQIPLSEISDNLGISQARFYLCDSGLKSELIM